MLQANLRPESPVPGFPCHVPKFGAPLDSYPKVPRMVPGVFGVVGVSGLWTPESPVCLPRALEDTTVVRYWIGHRRYTGRTPESPPPWTPESPVWPGDSKVPESGGVSGLHRSLRPSYTVVSGPSGAQRADFSEGYKYPSTYLQPVSSTSIYEP